MMGWDVLLYGRTIKELKEKLEKFLVILPVKEPAAGALKAQHRRASVVWWNPDQQ